MNKHASGYLIIIIFVIVILFGLMFYLQANPNVPQFNHTTNYTNVTINVTVNSILPNPTLAPGDVLTNNLSIICHSGYSATVRDVPQKLREEVFARDNVVYPQPTGTTELDHIIPLCLGGNNLEDNLYVEFAEPRPGYKEKDKLENYLCDHVCTGEINIDYAQQRIATDWYSYYKEIYR